MILHQSCRILKIIVLLLTIKEILKKVRQLEIKSKQLTSNLFSGEYHSAFKGNGMSFKEVREYAAGDDIRFIDWNVSARFGHPFSKRFSFFVAGKKKFLQHFYIVFIGTHMQ